MKRNIDQIVERGAGGHIYAIIAKDDRVSLVPLGDHAQVRYFYNQIACLVGGLALQTLRTYGPAPGTFFHAGTKPPHHWVDTLFEDAPIDSPESLFGLAARGPSPDADKVGNLAFAGHWPQDMWRLKGITPFTKCMGESLGRVFYDCLLYPTVRVGTSAEHTVVRRTMEAITAAKLAGFAPHDEPALMAFLQTLTSATALQFFHEVTPA